MRFGLSQIKFCEGAPSRFDTKLWKTKLRAARLHKTHNELYKYLLKSLSEGFSLQLDEEMLQKLSRSQPNLKCTELEAAEIDKYWKAALEKGWLTGPFNSVDSASNYIDNCQKPKPANKQRVHLNPLFCVYSGNKYRVITHFSAPRSGVSVNSAVQAEWATVQYISFRKQCEIFNAAGKDGWIWVVDAEEAYLQLKVRPDQRYLMGAKWRGLIYLITVLMLGLSCAPRIYTHFADAVLLMLLYQIPRIGYLGALAMIAHYLDDFFGAHPSQAAAKQQFEALKKLFTELNIPFKPSKCKDPAQLMQVLGFLHNTILQAVFIPDDKRQLMLDAIGLVLAAGFIDKEEAQSLVGRLRWAANVYFGGACFVRSLEAVASLKRSKRRIKLDTAMRADLGYWAQIISENKGMPYSFILSNPKDSSWIICSDASSHVGFAATSTTGHFFQMRWTELWPGIKEVEIYFGEMLAMAVMLQLCEQALGGGKNTVIYLDNEGAKYSFQKKYCKLQRKESNRLLRETCILCNRAHMRYWAERIPTEENAIADALSRFEPVDASKQPSCYGVHPLDKQFSQLQVKLAVVRLLGEYWSPDEPPVVKRATLKEGKA